MAFFLRGVFELSQEATETARRILLLRESHRQSIIDNFGRASGNGQRVLEYLFRHPIISVADVERLNHTTFAAANNLVNQLADIGVL